MNLLNWDRFLIRITKWNENGTFSNFDSFHEVQMCLWFAYFIRFLSFMWCWRDDSQIGDNKEFLRQLDCLWRQNSFWMLDTTNLVWVSRVKVVKSFEIFCDKWDCLILQRKFFVKSIIWKHNLLKKSVKSWLNDNSARKNEKFSAMHFFRQIE